LQPDVISVVRPEFCLQLSSNYFTMDTLALGYTLPTTRACYGLSSIRLRLYWAHIKKV